MWLIPIDRSAAARGALRNLFPPAAVYHLGPHGSGRAALRKVFPPAASDHVCPHASGGVASTAAVSVAAASSKARSSDSRLAAGLDSPRSVATSKRSRVSIIVASQG